MKIVQILLLAELTIPSTLLDDWMKGYDNNERWSILRKLQKKYNFLNKNLY